MADAYNDRHSTDVVLTTQDMVTQVHCHKLALASASNYIRQLLLEDDHSFDHPSVVIIPDVSGEVLKLIKRYIYFGQVDVNSYVLPEFLAAAKSLGVKGCVFEQPSQYDQTSSS